MLLPEFIYPDGSIVIDAVEEVVRKRADYLAYYAFGDYSIPPPDNDFYASALNTAKRFQKNYNPLKPQSGVIIDESLAKDKTQVLTDFSNDTTYQEVSFGSLRDKTYYNADSEREQLRNFLSRPVQVASYVLTPNTTTSVMKSPQWIQPSAFFLNKRVVNRMNNYRNFKCDLCFKFLLNGSPFHYGRLIAAVIPNTDNTFPNTSALFAAQAPDPFIMRASQLPCIYMNPTTSQGGCLRLPYLHQFDAFNTALNSHLNMGYIALVQIGELFQLSTATDTISLTVMCWAENVVFGAPTNNNIPGLVPQSGDEYSHSPIQDISNTLQTASESLAKYTVIRPYALASATMFKVLGFTARILGFSKPAIVSDFQIVRERKIPNLASTVQHDPINKLTFDDKQEVTVDPSVVGFQPRDEMLLSNLFQKESFVNRFLFSTNAPLGNSLQYYGVTPAYWNFGSGTGTSRQISLTSLCYASFPFANWRGSLRFRFVAVASSFHRGRIRIVYDPGGFGPSNVTLPQIPAIDHNTTYNYIWDIAENHEAIIDVKFMSPNAYCRMGRPTSTGGLPFSLQYGGGNNVGHDPNFDNGTIGLFVQNDLTASNVPLSSIEILCFISAGEDFEVFNPTDALDNYSFFPQSGELLQDDLHLANKSLPHAVFGENSEHSAERALVFHGDPVKSIRCLLKRYTNYCFLIPRVTALGQFVINWSMSAFPLHRGRAPNGIHLAGTRSVNYVYNTPLAWYSAGFMARRGGTRIRIKDMSTSSFLINHMQATRSGVPDYSSSLTTLPVAATASAQSSLLLANLNNTATGANRSGFGGLAIAESLGGGSNVLDFEVPYHSPRRYFSNRLMDNSLNHSQGYVLSAVCENKGAAINSGTLLVTMSAADDFSLSGFLGSPLVYHVPTLT